MVDGATTSMALIHEAGLMYETVRAAESLQEKASHSKDEGDASLPGPHYKLFLRCLLSTMGLAAAFVTV